MGGEPGADAYAGLVGGRAVLTRTVRTADTAAALGSGDVPVLATPRLLAWLEAATVEALRELPPGDTSVGVRVELEHLRATCLDAAVTCTATVTRADGRIVTFAVEASEDVDGVAEVVARGEVVRAVVDRARFLSRVRAR